MSIEDCRLVAFDSRKSSNSVLTELPDIVYRHRRFHDDALYKFTSYLLTGWRGGATGKAFGLAISRSRLQILLEATLRNNLRQVVYTYVPLSPSSITWYRPKGGDAVQLGR